MMASPKNDADTSGKANASNADDKPAQERSPGIGSHAGLSNSESIDPLEDRREKVIAKLLSLSANGTYTEFKKALIGYFCEVVPTIFMPKDNPYELLSPTFDQDKIQKFVRDPLQHGLLGVKTTGPEFLKAIKESDVPSGNCGKIFKIGESTYSCRDCAADPTCVLCNDCFNHSDHKYHRYKISSSSGGGCCDCGDYEAWRKDVCCALHKSKNGYLESCILDPKTEKLAEWIIKIILRYANDVLSNDYAISLESIPVIQEFVQGTNNGDQPYAVILYNDEIHTFEIVIQTIQKVLQIGRKPSEAFTNKIHHEGRAVLRSTNFEECVRLRDLVTYATRQTSARPLRVQIQQSLLVAHQHFAEFLIVWLTCLLNASSSYRYKFNQVVSKPYLDASVTFLQTLLINDTKPWKNVRELWHRLIIGGMFKDNDIKRDFAVVFGDYYDQLMADFSVDDHEHAYSVTSLTVQIFTVPSLAQELMERGLFSSIMRTILSEVEPRVTPQGIINFERTGPGFPLRRTHFALVDIKYLLTTRPPLTMVDKLKKEFVSGFAAFTKLCTYIQESDPVTRMRINHVERDPDWETAFNIHTKVAPVISLLGEWIETDMGLTLSCYRIVVRELLTLEQRVQVGMIEERVGEHTAMCYNYDVSRLPVSIYLCLTRLYAIMYLCVYKREMQDMEVLTRGLTLPSQQYIMEAPLRTLTLVAQRHAGMWKRNGISLLNQIFFYQNVRCRGDMLDKDLLTLQIAAAQMDSNEFLIRVLNKMDGIRWLSAYDSNEPPDADDADSYTTTLFEEFLLLVISMINGRYLPGVGVVTPEDCVKKQIIQTLCIGAMAHSELNKYLEEDLQGETGIERVVRYVADLKKTPLRDVYELRPEYYADYDVFYYHYARDEIPKAEQAQRARKLAAKEPDVFPPPILPPFHFNFAPIINLLKCDVMIKIMSAVIFRCTDRRAYYYSDVQLRRVLHLIGYGLNEELESKKSNPQKVFLFSEALAKADIPNLLCAALTHPKAAPHKEMIAWVIKTYEHCLPTPEKILPVEDVPETDDAELRKQRAAAAKARSMASISTMQKKFRAVNADLFEEHDADECQNRTEADKPVEPICLGPNRTSQSSTEGELRCILCMEKQDGAPLFTCSLIQRSAVLAQKTDYPEWTLESVTLTQSQKAFVVRPDLAIGIFTGSCGHVMHLSCWKQHHANIVGRERMRSFRHLELIDTNYNESLCPMCEGLHNALLPVYPPIELAYVDPNSGHPSIVARNLEDWLRLLSYTIRNVTVDNNGQYELPTLPEKEAETFGKFYTPDSHVIRSVSENNSLKLEPEDFLMQIVQGARVPRILSNIKPIPIREDVQTNHGTLIALWNSIAFTITSFEMSNRYQQIPFFGEDVPSRTMLTMTYLTRYGGVVVNPKNSVQLMAAQIIAIRTAQVMLNHQDPGEEYLEMQALDPFSLLVVATFSFPYLFAKPGAKARIKVPFPGKETDVFIFQTVLFIHMSQLLRQEVFVDPVTHEARKIKKQEVGYWERFCRKLWDTPMDFVDWDWVLKKLEELVVPFVTCCCKFYECYSTISPTHFLPQGTDLKTMLKFLGQPTDLRDYFDSPRLIDIGYSYMLADRRNKQPVQKCNLFPRKIRTLVKLPTDFLQLVNSAARYRCNSPSLLVSESRHPTICLICGEMMCCQSPCCLKVLEGHEIGGCAFHAQACGNGTGMFLRIRDCKAFVFTGFGKRVNQGCYVTPPYVDENGEPDQGLRRGNPLTLSADIAEYLEKLWINHGIPEEIVRVSERNLSVPSAIHYTNWQHF